MRRSAWSMASSPPRSRTFPARSATTPRTKPLYQKWSQKFAERDRRQKLRQPARHARPMWRPASSSRSRSTTSAKRIEICGKVVDDAEWQKVEEGVYTGFSQGGRYLKRWPDPDEPALMRYTAEPLEVSLVDHPCLPEATFAVIKADGSTELRKFKAGASRAGGDVSEAVSLADAARQDRRAALQGRQGAHQKDPRSSGRARSGLLPRRRRPRCACRVPPAIFAAGR